MELMKTSIKAILDNIICAEEFLDEDAINEFEEIIMNKKCFCNWCGKIWSCS